jgi:hypothetical protein
MITEEKKAAAIRESYSIAVNGKTIKIKPPEPNARQVLDAAEFVPADECVLIKSLPHGTVSIGLDETIDLREPGTEVFYAFRSDRIFRFTVDERGFEWGTAIIKEPTLRGIAHVKADEVIFLERGELPDRELGADDEIDLSRSGTEHLRIEKRLIEVFFKDKPFLLPRGVYTTEQLTQQFPIEQGYLLNLLKPDNELVTLKPGEKIRLKCGMKFYSQVPGGGSS